MNIWLTADTHFDHNNIIKYCNRPFSSLSDMNETMIERWNFKVKENDIVYFAGDFALRNESFFFQRLNGKKYLIKGNHDGKDVLKLDWGWIKDLYELNINKKLYVITHYAMLVWNKSHYGSANLFGHSHGMLNSKNLGRQLDIGVDCWNFFPVSIEEIEAKLSLI